VLFIVLLCDKTSSEHFCLGRSSLPSQIFTLGWPGHPTGKVPA
jgi:hypothetical protein